jgi:hypothetical protein
MRKWLSTHQAHKCEEWDSLSSTWHSILWVELVFVERVTSSAACAQNSMKYDKRSRCANTNVKNSTTESLHQKRMTWRSEVELRLMPANGEPDGAIPPLSLTFESCTPSPFC